ncbi:MAG: N-6 DNA methylase [Verrucomicrobia bacterium]|nr:N-6 DNA methylase [Verrucomicrobiota bacterium]
MAAAQTASVSRDLLDQLRSERHSLSEQGAPLAAMLYLRWADFQEAEAEAMAAFDESDYKPLLPASLHWRRWHDVAPAELPAFFIQTLPDAVEKLSGAHDPVAASLQRILPAIRSVGELSAKALAALVEWLAAQPFETPKDRLLLLALFDEFLDHTAARESGQFRTPAGINDLLVALAAPAPGERLYDPCFGFAGILTAASRRVRRSEKSGFARNGIPALEIAGVEMNPSAFAIGLARLALAGVANPQLELGNSLERESATSPQKEGFDLVISDPPWGGRLDPRGLDHFPIQTSDSTGLFVQHAVSQLRPDGRAVMVVPQGFLFREGKIAALRQWLFEHHRVDGVIGLPEGGFLPYTGLKAAVLLLRRNGGPTERLRMVDGTEFFEPRKGGESAVILPRQIEALVGAMRSPTPGQAAWDVEAKTLAELDYDLTPVRRDKSALEETLRTLGHEMPVVSLKEVCRISSGAAVKSRDLTDRPIGDQPVPYVRLSDVQHGQAGKVTSWIQPEAADELGPRYKLRAGEVLLSRSGTIGKAGVVRNGAVGGIASNGFFVLSTTDRIDPHFLVAYLASGECKEWLQSKSGGAVIKSLKRRFVEELPTPLPPLPVQHRVAAEVRERGVDALTQLGLLLTQDENDPLARWIDRSLRHLEEASSGKAYDASRTVWFRIFGRDFDSVRAWAAAEHQPPLLMDWALKLVEVADLFRDSEDVPRGPALLSILEQAFSGMMRAYGKVLKGESPLERKATQLNAACVLRLRETIDALLDDVRIVIRPKAEIVPAGVKTEFFVLVQNQGPLPLRNFKIASKDWGFKSKSFFLPESSEQTLTFEVETPAVPGRQPMTVEWNGTRLDGKQRGGREEIVVETNAGAETKDSVGLGLSPYFISQPVGPERDDVFFGREEVIEQSKRQIQSGNTVLLEGNRRAGKSSILKHLEGPSRIPGWLAVYSSFQAAQGDDKSTGMATDAVWRTLAQSLASGLLPLCVDVPLPDGTVLKPGTGVGIAKACRKGISVEAPWEDFQDYLRQVLRLLGEMDRGLVLMIDEFDKLQEGIDNGVTSPQIPDNIRYLIQTLPRFTVVLTGSRRMQRLRHEYWSALYGLGNRIGVSALDDTSARLLVTKPVEGRLIYTAEALDLVVELTARQPFLIQSLCNRIFEFARHLRVRSVTLPLVNEAASAFVRDNEHFASLWGYAETDRRRFILLLCHRESAGPDPLTLGVLQERLRSEGLDLSDAELDADLKGLQELELIDYLGAKAGGTYSLAIPLMGQWFDAQQDFHGVRARALAEQEERL